MFAEEISIIFANVISIICAKSKGFLRNRKRLCRLNLKQVKISMKHKQYNS